jgi:hypothetical protein
MNKQKFEQYIRDGEGIFLKRLNKAKLARHTFDVREYKNDLKQFLDNYRKPKMLEKQSIENPVDLKRFQKQENRNLNLTQR